MLFLPPFFKGSTLTGKNLLLLEQILSLKSRPFLNEFPCSGKQIESHRICAGPRSAVSSTEPAVPGSIPCPATYLFLLRLIQERRSSVTDKSMCTKYWLTASTTTRNLFPFEIVERHGNTPVHLSTVKGHYFKSDIVRFLKR